MVLDGPINGLAFQAYVDQVLVPELKPGDMLFIPQNRISKIRKFLPVSSLSTFFTPAQF